MSVINLEGIKKSGEKNLKDIATAKQEKENSFWYKINKLKELQKDVVNFFDTYNALLGYQQHKKLHEWENNHKKIKIYWGSINDIALYNITSGPRWDAEIKIYWKRNSISFGSSCAGCKSFYEIENKGSNDTKYFMENCVDDWEKQLNDFVIDLPIWLNEFFEWVKTEFK